MSAASPAPLGKVDEYLLLAKLQARLPVASMLRPYLLAPDTRDRALAG